MTLSIEQRRERSRAAPAAYRLREMAKSGKVPMVKATACPCGGVIVARSVKAKYCPTCLITVKRASSANRRAKNIDFARESDRLSAAKRRASLPPEESRRRAREASALRRSKNPLLAKKESAEQSRKRRIEKPDAVRLEQSIWCKNNRDKMVAKHNRRRARLADGESTGVSADQWAEMCQYFNGACAYCLRTDLPLSRDHVEPIATGGKDEPGNVVPACRNCNSQKGASRLAPWFVKRFSL